MAKLRILLQLAGAILAFQINNLTLALKMKDDSNVPCGYYDTVDLRGIEPNSNGSYLYEGTLIPAELVGDYDYELNTHVDRIDVKRHKRGCICRIKNCLQMCCGKAQIYDPFSNTCKPTNVNFSTILTVTNNNGNNITVNIYDDFIIQKGHPCEHMYVLDPQTNEYDEWILFENGTLLRIDDGEYLSKNEFCFAPHSLSENDTIFVLNPLNCLVTKDNVVQDIVYSYTMIFSIPFMILTIIIYLVIPELRNLHGKSLACYLLGLVVGYSILSFIVITGTTSITDTTCAVIGFIAYYFFMASFFWLSVISFDLWWNFRGTRGINRFNESKRFVIYSLYAWGLASLFLVFTIFAQKSEAPDSWKPGIGGGEFCWLNVKYGWSGLIYFYGPILIIITLNIILFIMTSLQIHNVQKEMARIMAKEDSRRNLRTEKDKFGLFLRLFIVMGVTWFMEIASYFAGSTSAWSKIFYVTDICNAIQGFLIFALFVLKKKVKHLIIKRYHHIRGTTADQRTSQYSTKTLTSSVNLTLNNVNSDKPLLDKTNTIPE